MTFNDWEPPQTCRKEDPIWPPESWHLSFVLKQWNLLVNLRKRMKLHVQVVRSGIPRILWSCLKKRCRSRKLWRGSFCFYMQTLIRFSCKHIESFLLWPRTCLEPDSNQPSRELLEPVNLHLNIKRNLAASWYKKMAAVEIDGDLKPMKVGGRGS